MKKQFSIIFLCLFLSNCSSFLLNKPTTIRIKGSDTMRILVQRWAEEYMKNRQDVSIYTEGGGSAIGIRALINNEIDICAASRPLRPEEARLLAEKYSKLGMGTLVAKDALSIFINPKNPVQDLSLQQLTQIFTGEISNWQQLGGNDEPITVLIRSPNSGTFFYFKEYVLSGELYTTSAKSMPTTSAVVQTVFKNRNAIGYGGIAYGENVIHCKINGVAPGEENVINDTYPIIRYLYLYTVDTPRGNMKAFIDWVLNEGQKIVQDVGYIPLWID